MHGPCGHEDPTCPCMKSKDPNDAPSCSKSFPKQLRQETEFKEGAFPQYRRRDNGRFVEKTVTRGGQQHIICLGSEWMVPTNPLLMLIYDAHINVEVCSSIKSVKYLFKYLFKGPDRAMIALDAADQDNVDEISIYQDGIYMGAHEAAWRLLLGSGSLYDMVPTVTRLEVHLPGQHLVRFADEDELQEVVEAQAASKSKLDA